MKYPIHRRACLPALPFLGAICLLFAPQGKAAVLLSNLSEAFPGGGTIAINEGAYYAFAFTTGSASQGYHLNAVTLALWVDPSHTAPITVAIHGSSPFPDGNGITLQSSDGSTGYDVPVSYSPTATLVLAPQTEYWIVLGGTLDGAQFFPTSMTGFTSSDGWIKHHSLASSWDGVNWSNPDFFTGRYAVDATVVPEPSMGALGCLGLAALLRGRRVTR